MKKTFHFISGLPRTGSTLLANILAQNPRFHTTQTSGVIDVILGIRDGWNNLEQFRAHPDVEAKIRVMGGILNNFYEAVEKPVVFDKSRGWLAHIALVETILGSKAKILVPVRDIRDILASFEKLWRNTSTTDLTPQERRYPTEFQTLQGRCKIMLEANEPLGIAYRRLKDAIKIGYSDRLHLIDFDDLTNEPAETFKKIYAFLEEPYFEHDFDNVVQITKEDDAVYGFKDLHTIRKKVEPIPPQWPKILGKEFENFGNLNFWKP